MSINTNSKPADAEFDEVAEDYDAALEKGIAVSGEDKEFFAQGRVLWLKGCLDKLGFAAKSVMDYGCGTGTATPFLFETLGCERLVGVDVSQKSLDVASAAYSDLAARFVHFDQYKPEGTVDAAYCNGTFHHIPRAARAECVKFVFDSLRPGGLFALWENNPWNAGTQYVMWRCPFDKTAVKVPAPEARRLVQAAGFEVVQTDFYFIFPNVLRTLRGLEAPLARFPVGAQYQVLCRKAL